jgi:hypothetical protein
VHRRDLLDAITEQIDPTLRAVDAREEVLLAQGLVLVESGNWSWLVVLRLLREV